MKLTLSLSFIFAAILSSCAPAALTVFLDRASWEAAAGGVPVVEDLNAVTPFVFADGQTLDTGKLTILRDGSANASDGALEIEDGMNFGNFDGTTFLSGETGIEPHETATIGFLGQSASAFGADFVSPFSGDGVALEVLGDLVLLDSIAGFDSGFVGVVSDTPFSSVQIVGNPDIAVFQELWSADNLSFVAVPEPSSLCLLLLGFGFLRRR